MINNVVLMGRLVAAPELKATPKGVNVTSFCLAVERRFQKQGEERQADFINCVAWRGTAEFICRNFTRGDMLAVTGEIQTRKFTDKEGKPRTAVEVVTDNASFCGGKNNNSNSNVDDSGATYKGFEPYSGAGDFDSDLPF